MNVKRASIALDEVRRIGRGDLDPGELLLEVADTVRNVVPFDLAGLLLLDPDTLLPLRRDKLGTSGDLDLLGILRNELLAPDVHKYCELAVRYSPAATLSSLGVLAYESERRREILDPIGLADELRIVFRHHGSAWGAACLMRASDAAPYDTDELLFLREIGTEVAPALRRSLARRTTVALPAAPGVMLLDRELQVTSITASARDWRGLMPEESMIAVQAVALRALDPAADEASRRGRIRLTTGEWLTARAAPIGGGLGGAGAAAVTLSPAEGSELVTLMARLHDLTGRESAVVKLLSTGLPYDAIAQRLSISRHTLGDHRKSIYGKFSVNSRAELMATLAGQRQ